MDRTSHWQQVYATKAEDDVSWFEASPSLSLQMMEAAGMTTETCVLDVGGGDSKLVDALVARGLTCLAILDISATALARARVRLGPAGGVPTWIAADVTTDWSFEPVDIWHDRAVFHFLTDEKDRARYREHLLVHLKAGGMAVIATFALDGPEKCSGLTVARYSPETLAAELGQDFQLVNSFDHVHRTPSGASQSFQYSRFTRVGR
jgi:trans-aconitate methyltransferase